MGIQERIKKDEKYIANMKETQKRYRPGSSPYEECQRRIDVVANEMEKDKKKLETNSRE